MTEFLIVSCHSRQFIHLLHWPDGKVKGRCGGSHHPCIFQVLMVTLISAVPLGMQCCFWFIVFFSRGSSKGFLFSFSNHNNPHSACQGINMRILPISKYIYSNYTFWNWGNNCRMSSGTYWTYCELYISKNSVSKLAPKAPTLTGGLQCFLGIPGFSVN